MKKRSPKEEKKQRKKQCREFLTGIHVRFYLGNTTFYSPQVITVTFDILGRFSLDLCH